MFRSWTQEGRALWPLRMTQQSFGTGGLHPDGFNMGERLWQAEADEAGQGLGHNTLADLLRSPCSEGSRELWRP